MTLPTQTFEQYVDGAVASWDASTGLTAALSPGDPLLAVFEAVASQVTFLQQLCVVLVNLTRAQTSTGTDLDTWMAQFNFTRLPGNAATGQVTFFNATPVAAPVQIPAGTIVQTTGGGVQYTVVADPAQPTWNASLNAYVLATGQSSLTATVQCTIVGTAGNIQASQITQIASNVPGINSVTNGAPFTDGVNQESDAAFRTRFIQYLATLARGTLAAILAAANSVQQGLIIEALENTNGVGDSQPGAFELVVDDGSGSPPGSLLTAIYNAVYAVRAFTVQPFVTALTSVSGAIVMGIRVASGFTSGTVVAAVKNAVAAYVNQTGEGAITYISSVEAAALSVAGVVSVEPATTTIQGVQADYQAASGSALRITVSGITVSTY